MKKGGKSWGVVWLFLAKGVSASCFTGEAYDLATGERLYSEVHRSEWRDGRGHQHVEYRLPDDSLLATKMLIWEQENFLPEYFYTDLRTQAHTRVTRAEGNVQIEIRESGETTRATVPLGSGNRWVADAGFDAFIRSRWEALRTGEAVELEFLAITRASFVAFVTREVSHDDEAVTFEVKALNPLIRLFVNPIRVTYDLRTRQLLRYAGLTDIALLDSSGKPAGNFSAEIRYHYHECPGQARLREHDAGWS